MSMAKSKLSSAQEHQLCSYDRKLALSIYAVTANVSQCDA